MKAMQLSMRANTGSKAVFLTLVMAFPVAVLTGLIAATGDRQLSVLWTAALGGVALLALSSDLLIWTIIVLALVVVGQAMYFAGLNQAVWIPYGLGLLLYFRLLMDYAKSPFAKLRLSPPLVFPVVIFIGAVLISMLINMSSIFQALRAAKSYLFLWSVFFLIAYGGVSLLTLGRIWRFCILLAFLQLPLVLYQYLFIASKRSNQGGAYGISWDAIVGGFGGDPMGGGASGTMAWFLIFVSVLCVALYRRDLVGKWLLWGVLATSAVCAGLAEVKVVVALLPLGMGALLIPYLKKNPIAVLFGFSASVIGGFGILVLYKYMGGGPGSANFDILETLIGAFWYSLDPTYINYATGEMGRVASLVHWWQENGLDDPLRSLFGHGPGASSISGVFGLGDAARKYPFQINRSALSIFLWDVGLVGVFAYLSIIIGAMSLAIRTSRKAGIEPFRAAVLEAIFGALFMILLMLPYGKDVTEVPALGVLLMLFLGFVSQNVSDRALYERNTRASIKLNYNEKDTRLAQSGAFRGK